MTDKPVSVWHAEDKYGSTVLKVLAGSSSEAAVRVHNALLDGHAVLLLKLWLKAGSIVVNYGPTKGLIRVIGGWAPC